MASIIVNIDGQLQTFALDKPRLVVGREPGCDVHIRSNSISRQHCAFVTQGAMVRVEDLGSVNGTFVGEERVREKVLRHNDLIWVGEFRIQFVDEAAAPKTAAHPSPAPARPAHPAPPAVPPAPAAVAVEKWYYAANNQRAGPVDLNALRNLIRQRVVVGSTLVWKQGLAEWIPASQVPGLLEMAVAATAPAPLPKPPVAMAVPVPVRPAALPAAPVPIIQPVSAASGIATARAGHHALLAFLYGLGALAGLYLWMWGLARENAIDRTVEKTGVAVAALVFFFHAVRRLQAALKSPWVRLSPAGLDLHFFRMPVFNPIVTSIRRQVSWGEFRDMEIEMGKSGSGVAAGLNVVAAFGVLRIPNGIFNENLNDIGLAILRYRAQLNAGLRSHGAEFLRARFARALHLERLAPGTGAGDWVGPEILELRGGGIAYGSNAGDMSFVEWERVEFSCVRSQGASGRRASRLELHLKDSVLIVGGLYKTMYRTEPVGIQELRDLADPPPEKLFAAIGNWRNGAQIEDAATAAGLRKRPDL